mmetsp:Transcript_6297/g.13018  ORF Transcript_6297/g.13018 Transcript_6297/m.13018 type:complete len:352 (+) Transcript_6297:40-1095(+)
MTANVVAFTCEWFDSVASMVRTFRINHFKDGTLEIINLKNRQTFLKRTYFDDIQRDNFFVGATITINCRQYFVADYADEGTRLFFQANNVRIFGLVKPEAIAAGELGKILRAVDQASFTLSRLKMVELDARSASRFDCASPGNAVAFEASVLGGGGESVAARWDSLARSFGGKVFAATSAGSAGAEAMAAFESAAAWGHSSDQGDVTCCVVKPHVLKEGLLGDVMACIEQELGLRILAVELTHLDRTSASAFFDVYKGVYPHYNDLVAHMISGPSVFLKIGSGAGTGGTGGVVDGFREACGPGVVQVAKMLRPKSLRARFGTDRVKNALHCTDLPADGALECIFFRHLLSI